MAFEDPKFWANLHTPRVDKRLSSLDVHQTNRTPPRKSPDGLYRAERRGAAARARRAARQAHKKANNGLSFRACEARQAFLASRRDANQFTSNGVQS